jgi:hypothetical protein
MLYSPVSLLTDPEIIEFVKEQINFVDENLV